jgi:hypothetical protein
MTTAELTFSAARRGYDRTQVDGQVAAHVRVPEGGHGV